MNSIAYAIPKSRRYDTRNILYPQVDSLPIDSLLFHEVVNYLNLNTYTLIKFEFEDSICQVR